MAKQTINTLKNWFKTGLKPTQAQFWDMFDSFFHKDEKIPLTALDGLQDAFDSFANNIGSGDSAYQIAVNNGFVGDVNEWLASLIGSDGKMAYQSALDNGFVGTEAEWLTSLIGSDGKSAYQIALDNGFVGTEIEWLTSLHGSDGDTPQKGVDYFDGDNGRGIISIIRTSGNGAAGTTDTYTITFTDASTTTFQVVNGANGTNGLDGSTSTYSQVVLPVANWDLATKRQTVNCAGVTTLNHITVSPEPSNTNFIAYGNAQVRAISQAAGTLTFECTNIPIIELTANIEIK